MCFQNYSGHHEIGSRQNGKIRSKEPLGHSSLTHMRHIMGSELDRRDLACYGFGATFLVKTILSEPRQAHVHVLSLTPLTPKPAKLKYYVRDV